MLIVEIHNISLSLSFVFALEITKNIAVHQIRTMVYIAILANWKSEVKIKVIFPLALIQNNLYCFGKEKLFFHSH